MIKTIRTLVAVVALSGTVGANVQAAEVTVQKGDTLWELSQVHNATVEDIKNSNQLSTTVIHPGDVLTISTEKHYEVKQGDTLWDIAKMNNVTIDQIKMWNQLAADLIHPGLTLVIFDQGAEKNKTMNNNNGGAALPIATPPAEKSTNSPQNTPAAVQETAPVSPQPVNPTGGKEITVKATAYTAQCGGCSGVTKTGVDLKANPNSKVISVDPSVIPLGSKVYVEGYGVATAADTGGSIKGNRIDVFIASQGEAVKWGAKEITVKILN